MTDRYGQRERRERPGSDDDDAGTDQAEDGDRFVVGIQVTEAELRFVVQVPTDIDSGWSDPEAFQSLVEKRTWEILDQESTLRTIAAETSAGATVTLGSITLRSDGTVVDHELASPTPAEDT